MEEELVEAARLYAARDWDGALEVLAGLDASEENQLEIAYFLGLCHSRRQDWDEALLYLEQVVTTSEDRLRVNQCRLSLAYVYTMTGRTRLAAYELECLVQDGQRTAQVLCALGHTAWVEGRADSAIKYYTEALEDEPEHPQALNGLGYVLACEGRDSARALTCCRKAVDSSPQNPAYLDSLGWAYYRLGFESEAREYLRRALSLAPKEAEIREHAAALGLSAPQARSEYPS